jgi:hypothetical protein
LLLVIQHETTLSPYAEALFVFCNRSRDKLKVARRDETGFCLPFTVGRKNWL